MLGIFHIPLASLSTHKILCLYVFARVHEGDLDLACTLSIQSLASSKDVTATVVWFMLLEIRVFFFFVATFGPKIV